MSVLDSILPAEAQKLVRSYGTSITYSTVTPASYSPSSGTVSNTRASRSVKAVVGNFDVRDVDGTIVKGTDVKLVVSGLDFETAPTTTDEFVLGGVTYKVVRVMPLHSGDLAAAYELQGRA